MTKLFEDANIAEIEARLDNATAGPWSSYRKEPFLGARIHSDDGKIISEGIESQADAEFIANSYMDITALIVLLYEERHRVEQLSDLIRSIKDVVAGPRLNTLDRRYRLAKKVLALTECLDEVSK